MAEESSFWVRTFPEPPVAMLPPLIPAPPENMPGQPVAFSSIVAMTFFERSAPVTTIETQFSDRTVSRPPVARGQRPNRYRRPEPETAVLSDTPTVCAPAGETPRRPRRENAVAEILDRVPS